MSKLHFAHRTSLFGLRAFLLGSSFAVASSAVAQNTPAARLLAPIPVDAPLVSEARKSIVRAAPPDGAYSVPVNSRSQVFGSSRQPTQQQFQPGIVELPTQQSQSLGVFQALRDALFGKPSEVVENAPPAPSTKFVPIGLNNVGTQPAGRSQPAAQPGLPQPTQNPREFTPVGLTFAGGVPAQLQPQPVIAPPQPIHGVYAGPPAYRWYGWGSVTPGANPYSPNGQYPKGSANWYAQTGATPGAFPIPVNVMGKAPGSDSSAYSPTTIPTPMPELIPTPSRIPVEPVPIPTPLPIPTPPQVNGIPQPVESSKIEVRPVDARPVDPRAIAQNPVVAVQPQPIFQPVPTFQPPPTPSVPTIPRGTPTTVSFNGGSLRIPKEPMSPIQQASAVVPQATDMPAETKPEAPLQPIAVSSGPAPSKPMEPTWQSAPKVTTTPSEARQPAPIPEPPTSWISTSVRGEATDENESVDQAIRGVCANRVASLRLTHPAAGKVVVAFTTSDEATAKAIAADIAKLREVRAFEVSFEASVMR